MISIIIITRNRADLLNETLRTLTRLKKKADEIIVVDNGYGDQTKNICLSYQKRLPLIYVPEKRREYGLTRTAYGLARNAGVKKAKGDLICFLDDDSLAIKNWLPILEKEIKKGYQIVGGSKIPKGNNLFSQIDYFITTAPVLHPKLRREERYSLSTSNIAIKKEVFEKIGLFNEKMPFAEDRNFLLRAKERNLKSLFCPQAKVFDIGSPKNLNSFLKRMIAYGSGIMASYLVHQKKESLSKFFPKNVVLLIILSPFLVTLETAYVVSRNFKQAPEVVLFAPLIFTAMIFWHGGLIKEVKNVR